MPSYRIKFRASNIGIEYFFSICISINTFPSNITFEFFAQKLLSMAPRKLPKIMGKNLKKGYFPIHFSCPNREYHSRLITITQKSRNSNQPTNSTIKYPNEKITPINAFSCFHRCVYISTSRNIIIARHNPTALRRLRARVEKGEGREEENKQLIRRNHHPVDLIYLFSTRAAGFYRLAINMIRGDAGHH